MIVKRHIKYLHIISSQEILEILCNEPGDRRSGVKMRLSSKTGSITFLLCELGQVN